MCALSVRLFGRLTVHHDGHVVEGLEAYRVQELFSYLLLHRERVHPRETLAGLLWGDTPAAQQKKYLRQAIWHLQTALEAHSSPGDAQVVLVEPEWVQINPKADLWIDQARFEQAIDQVRDVPGHQMDGPSIGALRAAADLYCGDLLEGWYQDWCLFERERLQNIYLVMLDKLIGACEARREYEAGLAYGARILRSDRARERTHRAIMRLHFLAGDRTAALRQYASCVTVLREELDVQPDRRTLALYEQIRADQFVRPVQTPADQRNGDLSGTVSLPEVLSQLRGIRAVLADIDGQLQRQIEEVEMALTNRPDPFARGPALRLAHYSAASPDQMRRPEGRQ
jgi:DNA-binding SARP family transcriptional activator